MLNELTLLQWILVLCCAFIFGISKAGVKGIAIIAIPLMAIGFGGKLSTGIVLPMLITGDILAVWYYNRNARWPLLLKLLPWVLAGVLLGVWFGKDLPELLFKQSMAWIILGSVGLMIWWDRRKSKQVPTHWSFQVIMGLLVGFTTMVGNMAGAFANIFFLAMRLDKTTFIGTAAWLFFIVNLFKVPFHIFVWGTISWHTFQLNLALIPAIILGFILGFKIIKLINENFFRMLFLILTAIGALIILL
jgi:uncharacterized membrane protein YfcA